MKIKSVEFIASFPEVSKAAALRPLPTAAFIGRSNSGKSTFINSVLDFSGIAKTGRTPGKTKLLNYFLVNDSFYFVDLPGYGFAKLPASELQRIKIMLANFFSNAQNLSVVVQLFDIRRTPSQEDIAHFQAIIDAEVPVFAIASKSDKINRSAVPAALRKISEGLGIEELPTPFSSLKKDNIALVRNLLYKQLLGEKAK